MNVHQGDLATDVLHKPTYSLSGSSATACFACNGWELREECFLRLTAKKCISPGLILCERNMAGRKSTSAFQRLSKESQNCRAFFGVQLASYQWVRLLPNRWNNSLKGCVVLHEMRDCAEWCYKPRGRAASPGQVVSTVFPSYQRRGSTNLILGSKDSISLPGHTSTDPRITVTVTEGNDLETTLSGGPWLDK